jgi:hypothetical protein
MDSNSSIFWDKIPHPINIFMLCSLTDVVGVHNLQKLTHNLELKNHSTISVFPTVCSLKATFNNAEVSTAKV